MKHIRLFEEYNDDNLNEEITETFPYESEEIIEIISTWDKTDRGADRIIEKLNFIMEGYGVEAIIGRTETHKYWDDTVALYINMGDTYNPTIIYDVNDEKFVVTTWGDWVEENQEKYNIK
jgi:hypothetical protein